MRAEREIKASPRQWFGTLTFGSESRFRIECEAEKRLGFPLAGLSLRDRYLELQKEAGRYLTLWIKRLRKAGHSFRYLATAEAHSDGFPHFHMVVHEIVAPITHKVLSSDWKEGFTKWKLIPEGDGGKAARYVTKYVSKNGASRIRASVRYGSSAPSPLGLGEGTDTVMLVNVRVDECSSVPEGDIDPKKITGEFRGGVACPSDRGAAAKGAERCAEGAKFYLDCAEVGDDELRRKRLQDWSGAGVSPAGLSDGWAASRFPRAGPGKR